MTEDTRPFGLMVRFTLRPGAEATFDALVAETAVGIRAHEPGTWIYACHHVEGEPRQRIFYELYKGRAAFEAHGATAHTRRFLAEREALLEGTEVDFLTDASGSIPVAFPVDSPDA